MLRTNRTAASHFGQLNRFILLLPRLNQLGQYVELATAFGKTQVLSFLVTYYFGLEFERKHATL